jgi:pyruvate kinase
MSFQSKRTKIVCTLGPASNKPAVIASLIKAGMNVARLNFSHGTYPEHQKLINVVRAQAAKQDVPIALLQDLQGPKIRVGELPKEGVLLKAGSTVVFSTRSKPSKGMIPVTYEKLHKDVKPGQKLLLADGLMDVKVIRISGHDVYTRVVTGGLLTSHKGLNLPETKTSVSAISGKDKKDLAFGVKAGVDIVALSFVRSAKDILELRRLIKAEEKKLHKKDGPPIKIIAKIEKREAVENIDKILEAADGLMVARGDLGIEMPAEDVPLIQKMLIGKALDAAKPIIVATQMLESMIQNPRPTRAEVSDVANAVIDHTDAVMLSAESAMGKYPLQAVETMARIIKKTEGSKYDDLALPVSEKNKPLEDAVSSVAGVLSRNTNAKAVLVASLTGSAGRIVSRYRPELPIFVATPEQRVCRQLACSWGVTSFALPVMKDVDKLIARAIADIKKKKWIKKGDSLIVVAGEPTGISGKLNLVEVKIV